jgi:hypothetical protein
MKKLIALGGLLIAASVAQVADAGQKLNQTVTINTAARFAVGAIGVARNTANNVEYIQCSLFVSAPGAKPGVQCGAANSAGTTATCYTYDASIVEAAKGMNSDGLIQFWYDASGTCTGLTVVASSRYAPKQL